MTNKLWAGSPTIDELNAASKGTMMEHLGIQVTGIGPDYLEGDMPVDHRTKQIYGILHGGASAVLAETLGSLGGHLSVDTSRFQCVGIEINCNHLKPARDGVVRGRATPIHIGKSTQVWEIRIAQPQTGQLVCVSRLTLAVIQKR